MPPKRGKETKDFIRQTMPAATNGNWKPQNKRKNEAEGLIDVEPQPHPVEADTMTEAMNGLNVLMLVAVPLEPSWVDGPVEPCKGMIPAQQGALKTHPATERRQALDKMCHKCQASRQAKPEDGTHCDHCLTVACQEKRVVGAYCKDCAKKKNTASKKKARQEKAQSFSEDSDSRSRESTECHSVQA